MARCDHEQFKRYISQVGKVIPTMIQVQIRGGRTSINHCVVNARGEAGEILGISTRHGNGVEEYFCDTAIVLEYLSGG